MENVLSLTLAVALAAGRIQEAAMLEGDKARGCSILHTCANGWGCARVFSMGPAGVYLP